jgi:hypothetical protein
MAAIIRETLVLHCSLYGELSVEKRLGTRAKANAGVPALVSPQPQVNGRTPDMPGRMFDADHAASGTRRGAGRSLRLVAASRRSPARIPPVGRGELWWQGMGA